MLFEKERKTMCVFVKTMFDRMLTNAAGGNLSWKVDDSHFIMTASGLSSKYLWDIKPEQILVVDKEFNVIEGEGKPTREINMHHAMYQADEQLNAIVHAHPKELMVYATMGIDMPLVCENVGYLGKNLHCLEYHTATTVDLANAVGNWTKEYSSEFYGKIKDVEDIKAYGLLLRRHGVIIGGESFFAASEMLERLETNAYVHLNSCMLESRGFEYRV